MYEASREGRACLFAVSCPWYDYDRLGHDRMGLVKLRFVRTWFDAWLPFTLYL